jgi:hypothetical protein
VAQVVEVERVPSKHEAQHCLKKKKKERKNRWGGILRLIQDRGNIFETICTSRKFRCISVGVRFVPSSLLR